jgi:hypothetical protein
MEHAASPPPRATGAWADALIFAGVGASGILMAHWPMFASGFRRLQVDLGDSRLIHYLLEHTYLWTRGTPGHKVFWDPPFFYPARNAAAYTDLFLSSGPPYWLYRALGASTDLSFGLWMVTMSAINFAAGVFLFRKGLGFDRLPATAASFLIAFGAPRTNQMGHQQLLPCFYVIMTVYALARLFGEPAPGRPARWAYWLTASIVCVLQFYAGVYLAWFLAVGLGTSAATALALRSCRGRFLGVVRRDAGAILTAAAVGALLLAPMVRHFLPVSRQVALHRNIAMYRVLHPDPSSWIATGPANWAWGWTANWALFRTPIFGDEHRMGIGFLTTVACLAGLYLGRDRPLCRLAAAVWFALCVATTYMPRDLLMAGATGASFLAMAVLYRDSNQPLWRAAGLAVFLTLLYLIRFPNEYLQSLSIGLLVVGLLEASRADATPGSWILGGVAIACVCFKFFAVGLVPTATAMSAAVAAPLALILKLQWRAIALAAAVAWVSSLALITYLDRPLIPIGGLAGVGLALLATAHERYRPPARLMVRALSFALPILVIYYGSDSIWLYVYDRIPGGVGIRAVGRIVMILLMPAALGLATMVQRLEGSGRRLAGGLLAACCMIEQGTSTGSYDAPANRAAIAAVARRVDPEYETFYYRPCDHRYWIGYQLDAMWASMESGRPTINGYSGYQPPEWAGFFMVETEHGPRVEDVLEEWTRTMGIERSRVQWIGSECPESRPD